MHSRALVFIGFLLIAACGREQSRDALSDVGTDVGSTTNRQLVHLYWTEGSDLVRGLCKDAAPVLRRNCSDQVQKLSIESLRRELSPNADRLKSLEADRTDLLAQIAEIDRRLSEQADNPDLLSQRDARSGELAIVEASIARHRERGELVERLFALMSDSSLVVTALSQSPRFSEFLPLLKELDQLFRRRAPVIHEWYDVRSGRGFRLVTTRRNQSYASSGGCGFGWSLIHCTDAKIYAFSLFESPLIAVIPPTMTVDAKPLKMLWSACQGDVSGTGIAMLFEQNRLDMTSVGSGLELPALCMR